MADPFPEDDFDPKIWFITFVLAFIGGAVGVGTYAAIVEEPGPFTVSVVGLGSAVAAAMLRDAILTEGW